MPARKKTTGKKRPTKKAAVKKVVDERRRLAEHVQRPVSIEDYFHPENGQLLNPRHEIFAQMWVQTFSKDKAVEAAGYKITNRQSVLANAHDVLKRPEVQRRVRTILAERATEFAVTEDWVVLKMIDVLDKALKEKPILDHEGNIVGNEFQDLRTALGTLKELGTNIGMFKAKDSSKTPNVTFNFNYGVAQDAEPKKIGREAIAGESVRLQ